jgi:hypothetical protein
MVAARAQCRDLSRVDYENATEPGNSSQRKSEMPASGRHLAKVDTIVDDNLVGLSPVRGL